MMFCSTASGGAVCIPKTIKKKSKSFSYDALRDNPGDESRKENHGKSRGEKVFAATPGEMVAA